MVHGARRLPGNPPSVRGPARDTEQRPLRCRAPVIGISGNSGHWSEYLGRLRETLRRQCERSISFMVTDSVLDRAR